jgi:hypothetical protein
VAAKGPRVRQRNFIDPATGEKKRELWVESPREGGWTVAYRLAPQDGQPVIAEVRVTPPKRLPSGGLSTAVLRSVHLSEPMEVWPEVIRALERQHGPEVIQRAFVERPGFSAAAARQPRRPGRGGRSDIYYAQAAQDYVAIINKGGPGARTPTKVLAQRAPFARLRNSEQAARDTIHAARVRGLLTRSQSGRAGGQLTEKAISLLKGSH